MKGLEINLESEISDYSLSLKHIPSNQMLLSPIRIKWLSTNISQVTSKNKDSDSISTGSLISLKP